MALKFGLQQKKLQAGRTRELESIAGKLEKKNEEAAKKDLLLAAKVSQAGQETLETQATATLDESQLRAKQKMLRNKYFVLEGPAGSGKTHIAIDVFPELALQVPGWDAHAHFTLDGDVETTNDTEPGKLCAGIVCLAWQAKVATNLRNRLPEHLRGAHAATIHNFLKFAPEFMDEGGSRQFVPRYDAFRKHSCPILLIDEIGTVSEHLLRQLRAASPDGTRIIVMGDINQLPPVAGRPVFPYMMEKWPTETLSVIHRQRGDSSIIPNSQRILQGKRPITGPDFILNEDTLLPNDQKNGAKALGKYLMRAMLRGDYDPDVDMVMTHGNHDNLGKDHINKMIKAFANGRFSPDPERRARENRPVRVGNTVMEFAKGDRVVSIGGSDGRIEAMPTGTSGVVTAIRDNPKYEKPDDADMDMDELFGEESTAGLDIDTDSLDINMDEETAPRGPRQASKILDITCPDLGIELSISTAAEFKAITHNWAGTVHRNQGLQHPRVFIVVHACAQQFLNREWLYTAVTRAQKQVTILWTDFALESALQRQHYQGSTPMDKAMTFIANERKNGKPDVSLPSNVLLSPDGSVLRDEQKPGADTF